jgi:hypothetical protein
VHIDGPFLYIDGSAPDPVEELLPVEGPFRVAHEELEEAKFRRADVDIVLAYG